MPSDKIKKRCEWCGKDPLYLKYHDSEWGRFVNDDRVLFELLVLESSQAGLSWITILRRRENYRRAFAGFNVGKVAKFNENDIEKLLKDEGIIRNRLKITATISNAAEFIKVQKEFGSFAKYLLDFFPGKKRIINHPANLKEVPVRTKISDAIAKDMKKRGFKFFGSVICYAYLQAIGFVDDHLTDCFAKEKT